MRRIRGEPVEVWLRHGRPARFVWRGRLYVVLFVRDKRVTRSLPGTEVPGRGDPPPAQEYWLVEATAQQATTAATYELCQEMSTGRWTLSRN